MPKITDRTHQHARLGRIAVAARLHGIPAAAKAGAAGIPALGLFASSPYTNEARAIDTAPNAVNATLVFSPLRVTRTGEVADDVRLCARNLNKTTFKAL
jgi:hypothetical protein